MGIGQSTASKQIAGLETRLDALLVRRTHCRDREGGRFLEKRSKMPKFVEMDSTVTLADQLKSEEGPVILVNTFVVASEDLDGFMASWAADATIMKAQPGFIATQLHRGIAGSGTFLNYAIWQSVAHFRAAFADPAFRARLADYPENATVSPHLFQKVEVPGICVA